MVTWFSASSLRRKLPRLLQFLFFHFFGVCYHKLISREKGIVYMGCRIRNQDWPWLFTLRIIPWCTLLMSVLAEMFSVFLIFLSYVLIGVCYARSFWRQRSLQFWLRRLHPINFPHSWEGMKQSLTTAHSFPDLTEFTTLSRVDTCNCLDLTLLPPIGSSAKLYLEGVGEHKTYSQRSCRLLKSCYPAVALSLRFTITQFGFQDF